MKGFHDVPVTDELLQKLLPSTGLRFRLEALERVFLVVFFVLRVRVCDQEATQKGTEKRDDSAGHREAPKKGSVVGVASKRATDVFLRRTRISTPRERCTC